MFYFEKCKVNICNDGINLSTVSQFRVINLNFNWANFKCLQHIDYKRNRKQKEKEDESLY